MLKRLSGHKAELIAATGIALFGLMATPLMAQPKKHTPNGCFLGSSHFYIHDGEAFAKNPPDTDYAITMTVKVNVGLPAIEEEKVMYSDRSLHGNSILVTAKVQPLICTDQDAYLTDVAESAKIQEDNPIEYALNKTRVLYPWKKDEMDPTLCIVSASQDVNDSEWEQAVVSDSRYNAFTISDDKEFVRDEVAQGANAELYDFCDTHHEEGYLAHNEGSAGYNYFSPFDFSAIHNNPPSPTPTPTPFLPPENHIYLPINSS